jgi:hypothetical protein
MKTRRIVRSAAANSAMRSRTPPARPLPMSCAPSHRGRNDQPQAERFYAETIFRAERSSPPVCATTALLCITMTPARAALFTVRTGDERIAPESLIDGKSLFVHHNISMNRLALCLPIVKRGHFGQGARLLRTVRPKTRAAGSVNSQKANFVVQKSGAHSKRRRNSAARSGRGSRRDFCAFQPLF